jgi:signal transduction histidine kinase
MLVAGLYLWAAALSRRLYRRDGSIGDAYLSLGLVFASLAQVATAVHPGVYTGVVSSGDLLRLAFDITLLAGIQAEARATLRHLRAANTDLARLKVVEVERAALAERAHLSRELHDGLAQNLWLAKLKAGRLAALSDLGPEATALTYELAMAIEAGLVEAQQAVATMRLSGEPLCTLHDLLSRSVDEFADRFGVRAEFECAVDLPALTPRAQAEALRIAQEALTNVRRHADATVVRVRAAVDEGRLIVAVGDNGCGFDPDAVGQNAFGLAGMRERAGLIGGELRIESAPQDGTRVSLVVPLVLAAAALGAGVL